MPQSLSLAEQYHRLTNYTREGVRASKPLDWSIQPKPFKEVVSEQRLSLRPYLPFAQDPFTGEPLEPAPETHGLGLSLRALSGLLLHCCGVTGVIRFQGGGGHALRAAPSAGALYPTEVYVAVGSSDELEPGIYHYQVHGHEIVRLWDGDFTDAIRNALPEGRRFRHAQAIFLFSGMFWRSAWRYGERGYRRILLDTGHALANLVAYAPHQELSAVPLPAFVDADLNGLLFFDDTKEVMLTGAALVDDSLPPLAPPLLASPRSHRSPFQNTRFNGEAEIAQSASVELHRGGACGPDAPRREVLGQPTPPSRDGIPLDTPPPDLELGIPEATLRRRSARSYEEGALPLETLGRILGYGFARGSGPDRSSWFPTLAAGGIHAKLVAFDVPELAPGVYEIQGRGEALRPVSGGDRRTEFADVAIGQEIARDCAAAVCFCASLAKTRAAWGERAYRYLHLDAGHLGERIQLAAIQTGYGACGIAGFLDQEAADLFQLDADEITLYLVTLGCA